MVDVIFFSIYVLLVAAVVMTLCSVYRSVRMSDPSQRVENRIPVRRISWGVAILLVVVLVVTFLLGNSQPMLINGERFSNTVWLKVSDMFIYTAIILGFLAVVAVVFCETGANRKLK